MSVTTTAEEKLALAKQKIKEARDLLIESVHEDTWGSDNWRNDYKGNIWDWEIVSYKSGDKIFDCIDGIPTDANFWAYKQAAIHSVRRISDQEVFSVGDEIMHREGEDEGFGLNRMGDIIGFTLRSGELIVGFMPKGEASKSGDVWRELVNVKKAHISEPKKPLFTTEDGVEIFEGDEYWCEQSPWFMSKCTAPKDYKPEYVKKRFSTEQAAQEYIILNKPVLSVNDVILAIKTESHGTYNESYEKWTFETTAPSEVIESAKILEDAKLKAGK